MSQEPIPVLQYLQDTLGEDQPTLFGMSLHDLEDQVLLPHARGAGDAQGSRGIGEFLALHFVEGIQVHGALFIFASKIQAGITGLPSRSAGQIYIYEVIGTAAGGIVFTYVLLLFFNSIQILVLLVCANLLVCVVCARLFPGKRTRILGIVSTGFFILTGRLQKRTPGT